MPYFHLRKSLFAALVVALVAPRASAEFAVANVSPGSGPTTGGTSVTITGSNFAAPVSVAFGGVAASHAA